MRVILNRRILGKGVIPFVLVFSLPSLYCVSLSFNAICFLVLTLIPLMYNVFVLRRYAFFEFISLFGLSYALAFPIPSLFRNYYNNPIWQTISALDLEQALIWSYRGFALFLISYLLLNRHLLSNEDNSMKSRIPKRGMQGIMTLTKWIGWLALGGTLGWILFYGGIPSVFMESKFTGQVSTLAQVLSYLVRLAYPFIFLYLILRWRNIRVRNLDVMFYVIIGLELFVIVGAGAKAHVYSLLIVAVIAASYSPVRFSVKRVLGMVAVFFCAYVMFGVITNYRIIASRSYARESQSVVESINSQVIDFKEALKITIGQESKPYVYDTSFAILNRFAYTASFTKIIQFTRGLPPYENAFESFLIPVYAFLPRVIFAEKASFFDSGDFASNYFRWPFGGISVTLPGSLYWAWGYWGICLGMALGGGIIAYIEKRAKEMSFQGGIYAVLMIELILQLLDVGAIFQSIVFSLLRYWVLLWCLFFFYRFFAGWPLRYPSNLAISRKREDFDRLRRFL